MGTIVWLSSELMFFAALFAMYFTIRSVSPELWDTEPELLNIPFSTLNTTVLVLSSFTCQLGVFAAEKGDVVRLRMWFIITFLMGSFFIGGQVYEYATLVSADGLTLSSNAYGSVFYLTTGFHGLHVTGGLIAFLLVLGPHLHGEALHPRPRDQRHRRVLLLALRRRGVDRPVRDHLPAEVSEPVTRLSKPLAVLGALSRRRRHRFAPVVLLLLALAATGGAYAALAPTTDARAAVGTSAQSIEEGRALFLRNCSSCHGLNAEGTSDGPSLVGVGAASVDFQVATGRMPAAQLGAQVEPKRVEFTDEEIASLSAYVASLGPGPAIPTDEDLDYSDADIALGGEIFRTNCAMCHNFAGSGGALTRGKFAPSLKNTTPRHMYEAMVTGPQSMPVFGDNTMTPEEKRAVIGFLKTTSAEPSPGGFALGKIGPVSEGAVGWLVGIGALIGCAVWLGAKAR